VRVGACLLPAPYKSPRSDFLFSPHGLCSTHDQREQAALGVGDLVLRTSEAGIKPYIVQLTGPLIRVISSQAFPPAIKNAMSVFRSRSDATASAR
jgi:hypothetical protein